METTDVDRLFVDTNILIYATNEASPWHGAANTAQGMRGLKLFSS